jgi:hypothetical protein
MPRLRTIPGVLGVQLVASATEPAGAGPVGATSAALDCPGATFEMILTLKGRPPAVPAATTAPGAPAPAPAPAGTAQTAVPGTPTPGTGP